MQITSILGQEIIKRVAKYIEFNLNIMDLDGKIVASTDASRIGETHIGAVEVLKTEDELIIHLSDLAKYPGTKRGVNLPIKYNKKIAGVVGASGNPDEMYRFTGLIRTAVEVVMEQLHIERQAHFKERQWSYWLHQLLHPSGYDKEDLEEEAEYALEVNIHSCWQVVVLIGEKGQGMLEIVRSEIEGMQLDVLFALPFSDDEIVICLPETFDRFTQFGNKLIELTGDRVRIGIGEQGHSLPGIRRSYTQAKQALFFAGENSTLTHSSNWQLERLIAGINDEVYESVCKDYAQSLEKLDEIYIETIDIFFDMNLSIKKTAEVLHVHRNTLLYRFEQVSKKIGLDPRSYQDASILKIIRIKQFVQMHK